MTGEELDGLQRAYALARDGVLHAQSGIDEARWAEWLRRYEHDLAELVATADLGALAGVR